MIQNEEYIEFDVKALFFHILRKWKPILICGLIIAMLLGGWMAFKEYKTSIEVDGSSSYWREYQQYQDLVTTYEDHIALTRERLQTLQEYIDESVLMRIDPRDTYRARAVYYVDTGYQIMPEYTYQDPNKASTLTWYYRRHLTNYTIFEEIGAQLGLDAKYVEELVEVTYPNEGSFAISVRYHNAQGASQILDMMQEEMDKATQELSVSIGTHTVTLMEDSCGAYIDETLTELQKDAEEEMMDLQDDLVEYTQELMEIRETYTIGELNVVTAFVKWFVIGGVLGAAIVILYLFVKTFTSNRIYATSQLISGFHTEMLGEVISSTEKLPRAARKINGLEGCLTENSEGNLELIAEKIRYRCGDATNILVCSDTETGINNTLAEQLSQYLPGIRLQPTGSLLKEAAALRALEACDAVVMIAQRDKSKNSTIQKITKVITSYDKKLLGFVVSY